MAAMVVLRIADRQDEDVLPLKGFYFRSLVFGLRQFNGEFRLPEVERRITDSELQHITFVAIGDAAQCQPIQGFEFELAFFHIGVDDFKNLRFCRCGSGQRDRG